MLNLSVGSRTEVDGQARILTQRGLRGHAVYGPYLDLDPGRYAVEFNLEAAGTQNLGGDEICAVLDVASEWGQNIHARHSVSLFNLQEGPISVPLTFDVDVAGTFEFRVEVTGVESLVIDEYCRVISLDRPEREAPTLFGEGRFPNASERSVSPIFDQHYSDFRRLYEQGVGVKIVGADVIVTWRDISFYAKISDDLHFIDEIFFKQTYNFELKNDCCVIDIGMNIGLATLSFARHEFVKEVHSFEPFRGTYERAQANLSLNPKLATKILPRNIGLADVDEERTVLIANESDSGAFSLRGAESGKPEPISVRSAPAVLRPIIEDATARGLSVVAKVDCEGSEFGIFRSLDQQGLLTQISAFMVEWHRGWGGTQRDLLAPLLARGFTVFDLTGDIGNGFFYAAKGSSI